jgi:hypothetical protein
VSDFISETEAEKILAAWKADAARIGREEDHSREVIISLFDATGVWSQPWRDAGYAVLQFDLAHGDDLCASFPCQQLMELREEGFTIKGVLAAPPCTSFSASGSRWWKTQHDAKSEDLVEEKYGRFASRYFESPLEYATTMVDLTNVAIEICEPEFFAIENPIGRFARMNRMPSPLLTFQPHYYGDPYTKKTQLFGDFNPNLPSANVAPRLGSLMHTIPGGKKQAALRSQTPEGFAYAFFQANKTPRSADSLKAAA